MSKVKVAVVGTVGKSVQIESGATVGAKIETNLYMPDGTLANAAKLAAYIGASSSGSGGATASAHRLLTGLTIGDDHPQYTRKDTLTTRGDIYVRGVSTVERRARGSDRQLLRATSNDVAWETVSPVITLGTDLSGSVTLTDLASGTLNSTIVNNAVTDAKLRDSAATSVIGRSAGSSGDPADIVASADTHVLRRASGVLGFGQITAAYVSDFDEAAQDAVGGILTDSTEIDFTYSDATPSITASIISASVVFAKLQNIATSRFVGRITASSGSMEALTGTQATTLLDAFTSTLKGLAPASGGGTANYLRADGTWAAPPGTGGSGTVTSITAGTGLSASPSSPITTSGTLSVDQSFSPTWSGTHTFSNPVVHAAGSATNPSVTFSGDTSTGAYLTATGRLGMAAAGALIADFRAIGMVMNTGTAVYLRDGTSSAPSLTSANDTNTGVYFAAADVLAVTAGATVVQSWTPTLSRFQTGIQVQTDDGSASAPIYSFTSDTDTGGYRFGANVYAIAVGGAANITFAAGGITPQVPILIQNGTSSDPGLAFASDTDTGYYRISANRAGFVAGGNVIMALEVGVVSFGTGVAIRAQDGSVGTPVYSFDNDPNSGIYRIGSDNFALVANGAIAFQVANLFVESDKVHYFVDGAIGAPGIAFLSDTDNGAYRSAGNTWHLVAGGVVSVTLTTNSVDIPAQWTTSGVGSINLAAGNNNDLSIGNTSFLRLTGNVTTSTLTGMAGGVNGRRVVVIAPSGSSVFAVTHEDTNSSAANRFVLSGSVGFNFSPNQGVEFIYDGVSSRWRRIDV